ncbi:MAG: hypothetical protein GX593_07820 [Actinomycetales bacterium]|nr:hypothetical protein [Actinomycetales bacterium]
MRRPLTVLVAALAALSLTAAPAAVAAESPAATGPAASAKTIKVRYGTFKAKTYKGKGTKVVKLPKGATRGLVTISAPGEGTLKVQALKKNRKTHGRPLVGKIDGPYKGTTVFGLRSTSYKPTYLKIESTSKKKWTVKVLPLHKAKALKKTQKGSGDAVYRVTLKKSKKWKLAYRSAVKDNLIVTTYGLTRNQVLVNKITKKYTGKVRVEDFSGFLVVRSSGSWTLKR